jgi:multidrug efflux pump subunit AcrA (membrane-fusion protein)
MYKKHIVASALLAALLLSGCGTVTETPTAPTLREPVSGRPSVEAAFVDDIFKMDLYELTVVPYVEGVSASISGNVEQLNFYPGKIVEKGDILLTLDQTSTRNAFNRLEQQLADSIANQEYTETIQALDLRILEVELEQLKAQGADPVQIALKENEIKQEKLEQKSQRALWELDRKDMEKELEDLKDSLEKGVLRAPISGRIAVSEELAPGSRLNSPTPFCYIADDSRLSLAGPNLPQYFLDNADEIHIIMGAGRYSTVLLDDNARQQMTPNISGVGYFQLADENGDTVPLTLGQRAQMYIIRDRVEDALLIPYVAIHKEGAIQFVYVYENDTRHRREITTGLWQNGLAHVTSGLEEGEYVYVS